MSIRNDPANHITLTIPRVCPLLLEEQRVGVLNTLLNHEDDMSTENTRALEGLLNMLDEWSDERYFSMAEKGVSL